MHITGLIIIAMNWLGADYINYYPHLREPDRRLASFARNRSDLNGVSSGRAVRSREAAGKPQIETILGGHGDGQS